MKRPMELTVYPFVDRWVPYTIEFLGKPVTGEMREYGYETPRGVFSGDDFPEKRLTTAELAAEYWRKCGDFESCAEGYRRAMDGYTYQSEAVEVGRLNKLRRFATLPHYDEATS